MFWKKIKEQLLINQASATKQLAARKLQAVTTISIIAMLGLNTIRIYDFIINPYNQGLPLYATFILLLFLLGIWQLGRSGKTTLSAWLLIITYTLPTMFCFYQWGADLPAAILMTVLIMMLAGIFLGLKSALVVAIAFASSMIVFSYLQVNQLIALDSNWRQQSHQLADALAYILIIGIIFLLAAIIVRENKKALAKADQAAQDLQQERDQLEIKVMERSRAIIAMRREKLEQLQTLASIGQLSGGIFHDIINPLNVVSLNLEQLNTNEGPDLSTPRNYIHQALKATRRINDLVASVNSCLRRQNQEQDFYVKKEIAYIKQVLENRTRIQNINININCQEDIKIKGGTSRFGQIMMNLLTNALDACTQCERDHKTINIDCHKDYISQRLMINVQDNGVGITTDNLDKICEPFFSTKKNNGKNIGLGLSVVKEIIESDFNGQLSVSSILGQGSIFTISLPLTICN